MAKFAWMTVWGMERCILYITCPPHSCDRLLLARGRRCRILSLLTPRATPLILSRAPRKDPDRGFSLFPFIARLI